MTSENPLIADVKPLVAPEDGIMVADFGKDAWRAAQNGDWCEFGIDAGAAFLDGLATIADPFGALLTSAFAWMMEHVWPLPEMLNAVAGDFELVQANAHTWANVADAMGKAAADMEQTVAADTAPWYGPAIDVYKTLAAGEAKLIEAASVAASAVGAAVSGAGIAVQVVRTTVRDLIASAMADLVQYLARAAVAAGVTLGLATPLLVADGIRIVAKWSSRIAEWLKKIVRSFQKLAEIVQKVKPALTKVDDALQPVKDVGKATQNTVRRWPLSDLSVSQQVIRNTGTIGSTYDGMNYYQDATGNEKQ